MQSEGSLDAGPSTSFSCLLDVPLPGEVSLASWCPTMDVCAIVTADGQLKLHRLNWQLLWVASPEALVTTVCWSPDGKVVAAGHEDGSISLYSVETGDVQLRHAARFARIAALAWADQAAAAAGGKAGPGGSPGASHSVYEARHKRFFSPPAEAGAAPAAPTTGAKARDPYDHSPAEGGAWPAAPAGLSVLVATDVNGRTGLWLGGEVQIARFSAGSRQAADGDGSLIHSVSFGLPAESAFVRGGMQRALPRTAQPTVQLQ
jgi:anaphase-promoting complex subunit 4